MRARAPASSANLGPGFDALALALSLYVEVSIEPADELRVTSTGEGRDLPCDATHMAAHVASEVLGHDRVSIEVHSDIPVGRGLGSSAALAVAAAAAAGADDPLAVGARVDGHPENAAASVLGGLVAAADVDGVATARRLALDAAIELVVLVPDAHLPTVEARRALPQEVPLGDASFNLGRMGLLVAGLGDHTQLAAAATGDRLHQIPRTPLFPDAPRLLAGMLDAGALATCWSGAGPTLLAFCTRSTTEGVRDAAEALLSAVGVPGHARILQADVQGLTISG
ncbi:MAG TPA: homoserine kinase [Acidimicrobiales bacterium]|nr:homoserine kinase [Acidimicrobiales bacterium]